jgi:hypothetical protein
LDLFVSNAFDERPQIARFTQCAESVCGNVDHAPVPGYENGQIYTVTSPPRTVGLRFSQKF